MPSRIEWYYEPRLLLVTHAGEVRVEDIKGVFSQAYLLAEPQPKSVYVLIDMEKVEIFPVNMREFFYLYRQFDSPKLGLRLICGRNSMVSTIMSVFARMVGLRIRFFDAIPQAIEWLRENDAEMAQFLNETLAES